MTYAYAIAFVGERFVMVRNFRRAWEMPGGKVEDGEDPEKAVRREFFEETGLIFIPLKQMRAGDGAVFFGLAETPKCLTVLPRPEEITDVGCFEDLPSELSFPREEYLGMLQEARSAVKKYINRDSIGDSASS